MYGEGNGDVSSEVEQEESTVPSSAGAMNQTRAPLSPTAEYIIEREARRLKERGVSVTMSVCIQLMGRHKPHFDTCSPRTVEGRLRSTLPALQGEERRSGKGRRLHTRRQ